MELPLVSIQKYYKDLHESDILTFEAFTKEAQEILRRKLLPSKDSNWLELTYLNRDVALLKPESIKIGHKTNTFSLYCKSGLIKIPFSKELLELIANNGRTNVYYEVEIKGKKVISDNKAIYMGELKAIYEADYDFETAKELLKDYPAIILLMYALGYIPTGVSIAMRLPQLIPLFTFNEKAIHTVTLTTARYGKSRCARILMGLANAYKTVLPKPAKLVYNANLGKYGLTYFYNTLYIDEFEKCIYSSSRRDTFREVYEILLDGLSDGFWQRDTSGRTEDFVNPVGFCFMGNISNNRLDSYSLSAYTKNNREKLRELLDTVVESEPFIERMCYIEFVEDKLYAYRYLNYGDDNRVRYLHPKVSRAIIKILQDKIEEVNIAKKATCELDIHFNELKAVLTILGIELEDYTIEKLVQGEKIFLDVREEIAKCLNISVDVVDQSQIELKVDEVEENNEVKFEEYDLSEEVVKHEGS